MSRDFSLEPLWHKHREDTNPQTDRRSPMPRPPDGLLEWLEAEYPARCRLRDETELEHERYAGAVELIAVIRQRLEGQHPQEKDED